MTIYEIDEQQGEEGLHLTLTINNGGDTPHVIQDGPFASRDDLIEAATALVVTDLEHFSEDFGKGGGD